MASLAWLQSAPARLFFATLPRTTTPLPSPCPFATLRIRSLSVALREYLGLDATAPPDALMSNIRASDHQAPLQLKWPTQDEGIEEAYASTNYLAYPPDDPEAPVEGGDPAAATALPTNPDRSSGAASPHAGSSRAARSSPKQKEPLCVRLHQPNSALDAFLSARRVSAGTFITSWNPRGARLDRASNDAAHERLVASIESQGRSWLPHTGRADDAQWAEHGALVLGWDESEALAAAARFAQNAVVHCEQGKAPRLLWQFGAHKPATFAVHVDVLRADGRSVRVRVEGAAMEAEDPKADPMYVCSLEPEQQEDEKEEQ